MGIIIILRRTLTKAPVADAIYSKIQRARERIGGVVISIEHRIGTQRGRLARDAATRGGRVEDSGGVVIRARAAVGGELDSVAGADAVALVDDVVGVAGGVEGGGRNGGGGGVARDGGSGALFAGRDLGDGGGGGCGARDQFYVRGGGCGMRGGGVDGLDLEGDGGGFG